VFAYDKGLRSQSGEFAMATKKFASGQKFQDFEILDGVTKIGSIRVKPSGVLWAPKGSHDWYGLNLKQFADFMEKNGKKQVK
jgi:hypothetical protein